MKLSAKFTAVIIMIVFVPVLALGILLNIDMNQAATQENAAVLTGIVRRTADSAERYLQQIGRTVDMMADEDAYRDVFTAQAAERLDAVGAAMQLLKVQTKMLPQCRAAYLVNTDGVVVISMSGLRVGEAYLKDETLAKVRENASFFSGILHPEGGKTYFFRSAPIYRQQALLGYIITELDTAYFNTLTQPGVVGDQGYLFFVDGQDYVFAHRYPERQLPAESFSGEKGFAQKLGEMRANPEQESGVLSYNYNRSLTLHGAYQALKTVDGYVVAVRSQDEVHGLFSVPMGLLNTLIAVAALACVTATVLLVVSVRRPIIRILRSIGSMLKESGYIFCDYGANNEFGWIADSLNRLNVEMTNILDELKEGEKRYRTALEAVSDIVWEYDVVSGKYTFMAKDKGMLGARRVENINAVNCPWAYAADPEEEKRRVAEFKRFVSGATRTYRAEYETRDIRGNAAWAESIATALKNKDDQIVKVIGSISDITQKKLYDMRVLHSAEYDKLTGVYNRATIERRIKEALPESRQSALMMVDLDNFKVINDTFGHQFGDQILKFVSSSISKTVCAQDMVGRIGGDEFVVFIRRFESEKELEKIADNIVEALQSGYEKEDTTYRLSGSVGVAKAYEFGADHYKTLLSNADFAMYSAKRKGKNKYNLFTEALYRDKVKIDVVAETLRDGGIGDMLTVSFEPVYCSRNDHMVRFIAEVDIHITDYPELSREEVYKIAAESNQQSALLEASFRQVCLAISSVEKYNGYHTCVAFPVPRLLLSNEAILALLTRVAQREGVNPQTLGFAIDPRSVNAFDHAVYSFIAGLKRISTDVELTGFGGTYTSYNVVSEFNLDSVRFADDIVSKALHSRKYLSILGSIMDIARQSATACTLALTMRQHEFFKERLNGCYYYCTGEKISLERFAQILKTKEGLMNKYDCPDYKSRVLESTIMGL